MDWRWKPRMAVASVALFLVVQLAIPTYLFMVDAGTSPRFGWQMFSTARFDPQFVVVTADSEQNVELGEVLARIRADLALEELVPPHLCRTVPGAIRVTWRDGALEC